MVRIPQFCVFVFVALAAYAQAQMKMTADQVFSFIKSSIQLHHDDRQVAEFVRKIKLSDRLEARRVEELQGSGAGPRTVAALRILSESSSSLVVTPPPPPPPPKPVIPPPDSVEQARVLHDFIQNARDYAKNLPNYMCVQVTRRRIDRSGTDNWQLHDTIQEQLSYVDGHEDYKVVMIDNRSVSNVGHLQLDGATSSGEFGSIYSEIFDPETQTDFEWDHWATLRGRRMYVFAFRVDQPRSKYSIFDGETRRTIVAGYHGLIYVDRDTLTVMRWRLECDHIPSDFPVKTVQQDVNYDFVKIADSQYVLPLKSEVRSSRGKYMSWNETEFHLYRRFAADTTITFEEPAPISSDKTKEEPAEPDSKK